MAIRLSLSKDAGFRRRGLVAGGRSSLSLLKDAGFCRRGLVAGGHSSLSFKRRQVSAVVDSWPVAISLSLFLPSVSSLSAAEASASTSPWWINFNNLFFIKNLCTIKVNPRFNRNLLNKA